MGRRTDTRDRMVDAAVALFARSGYTNVSLLDVVEEAQAPRGSIYHHFPHGKDELALEVAASWRYQIERETARLASKSPSAEAFLRAVVDHNRKSVIASDFAEGCAMSGIIANIGGEADEPLREAVGATFTGWMDAIADGLESKGLRRPQARQLAMVVVVAIEGAITVSRATHDTSVFSAVRELIPGLLAKK
jgi:AcrR family transcriptional regulator